MFILLARGVAGIRAVILNLVKKHVIVLLLKRGMKHGLYDCLELSIFFLSFDVASSVENISTWRIRASGILSSVGAVCAYSHYSEHRDYLVDATLVHNLFIPHSRVGS
jgi:hypothetical protein